MIKRYSRLCLLLVLSASIKVSAAGEVGKSASFKFSGFVDLRYTNFSTKDNPVISSGNPESGFGLEDGALYGNYEKANVSLVLDIAFRRGKDADLNSAAAKPNQSSNANFAIGYDKSQAYLKLKASEPLNIIFGQFDTIFGVELNDSKDRIFGKTGIVYDYTLPVTHTGLMLEYVSNGYYAKAFGANPNNKGSLGSSATNDDKTEYAAAIGFSNESLRGQVGYMTRAIDKASGSQQGNRTLTDVILGTTLGAFSLDLEYSLVSDPNKNTLTSTNNADLESSGQGLLALANYKFSDTVSLGLRYENVKDDPTAVGLKTVSSVGASVHYRLTEDLVIRNEYTTYDSKDLSDRTWKDARYIFSTLLSF